MNAERELSPEEAADQALRELTKLLSDPNLPSKAHFRCCTEGPTEWDILFDSFCDEKFGFNPNSDYKCWVRRLYQRGLIPSIPAEWQTG